MQTNDIAELYISPKTLRSRMDIQNDDETLRGHSEVYSFLWYFQSYIGSSCYRIKLPLKSGEQKIYNFPISLMKDFDLYEVLKDVGDLNEYISKPECKVILEQKIYDLEMCTLSEDQESSALEIQCQAVSEKLVSNYFKLNTTLKDLPRFRLRSGHDIFKYFDFSESDVIDLFNFCDFMGHRRIYNLCSQIYEFGPVELYPMIIKNLRFQRYLYETLYLIKDEMVETIIDVYTKSPSSVMPLLMSGLVIKNTHWRKKDSEIQKILEEVMKTELCKQIRIYYALLRKKDAKNLIYEDSQVHLKQPLNIHDHIFALNENNPLTRALNGKMKIWFHDAKFFDAAGCCIDIFKYYIDKEYREYVDSINHPNVISDSDY